MINLIAFDLDDTALMPDGKPSPAGLQAIEDALDRGILVASVSGRNVDRSTEPFQDVLPLFNRLYIVANNGSIILSPVEDGRRRLLFEQRLPAEVLPDLLDYIETHGLNCTYNRLHVTPDGIEEGILTNQHTPAIDAIIAQNGAKIEIEPALLRQLRDGRLPPPPKMLILPGLDRREVVYQEMCARYDTRLYLVKTSPDRIEVMHPEVNKKAGVESIACLHGFSLAEVMAIGDGDNDLPMLVAAGLGVVMGNSNEAVKHEGVTRGLRLAPPCADDGFAWAVREYALGV